MDQKDKWPNDVVLKTLFMFFAFNPVTFSTVKDAERCSSNGRPLASVMGALMVVDPQPAARYQPAEPYINRAASKSKGG